MFMVEIVHRTVSPRSEVRASLDDLTRDIHDRIANTDWAGVLTKGPSVNSSLKRTPPRIQAIHNRVERRQTIHYANGS